MMDNNISAVDNNCDELIYDLNGKAPFKKLFPFALQQVLSMFISNMTPALLISSVAVYNGQALTAAEIARILQSAMVIAGVGTIIQGYPIWKIGSRLPLIMGVSFNFLAVAMNIAAWDYSYLIGAVIIGGICEGILGLSYKYWSKFITPLVSGCTVMAIGFSIIGSAVQSLITSKKYDDGSIENYTIGIVTMLIAMLLYLKGHGYFKQLYILIALVIGYILALIFGIVDIGSAHETIDQLGIISLPPILYFKPKFNLGSIIAIILIFMTSAAETIGDTTALINGALNREPAPGEISGSLACDGLVSSLSGVFGCTPITTFSAQIGICIMTRIINRRWVLLAGLILIFAGFFPPVGALLSTIPDCVLGGISVIAFGSILLSGLKMVYEAGLNERNMIIASASLTLGIGLSLSRIAFVQAPELVKNIFENNTVACVFTCVLILETILPKSPSQDSGK